MLAFHLKTIMVVPTAVIFQSFFEKKKSFYSTPPEIPNIIKQFHAS